MRSGMLVGLTALLLAMVAGLAWWAWTTTAPGTSAQPIPTPTPAPAAATAVVPPQPIVAKMSEAAAPSVAATPPAPVPVPAPAPAPVLAKPTLPVTAQSVVKPAVAAVSTGPAATLAARNSGAAPSSTGDTPPPLAKPLAAAETVAANPDPQAAQLRQAQAGRETLAQAQALWSAGSHDAATDLLQQALALAQHSPGAAGPNGPVVASLAREWARMQLADGRAAAALELLTRLEPLLNRDADVWALRANAAQRLARHQDSVQAYATALQLRPNTQRWLLGSAVSLAALGQTVQAGEMASRARAQGPVSPEVLAYLRHAGVPLGEP
jgi:Tfp pilus assembly protein PilF